MTDLNNHQLDIDTKMKLTKSILDAGGLLGKNFETLSIFESFVIVDNDSEKSDELIMNNPVAVSRLQGDRPDGSREERIQKEWQYFINKHGIMVNQIPDIPKEKVLEKLKKIKP